MTKDKPAISGSRANTLDSLLLPDTTDDVRELYHGLEDEAKAADFGPLEDGVVVLDTETTGLSFRDCELIEIAAAKISGREVIERFQTFVHPKGPIPREIQRLTHITDLDVAEAPLAEEAVASLAEFVGGAPVLAHNALFDRTFVEKVRGGRKVSDIWIDTLALSRIALPRLKSHRLSDMAQAFHCDSVTHRASDDVDALCGMWRIILCGLRALPAGLLSFLADMSPDVDWAFRPVLSYVGSTSGLMAFDLKTARKTLLGQRITREGKDNTFEGRELRAPDKSEIEDFFGETGPLSREYGHYEFRSSQVEMALEVRDALSTGSHRVLEVGTGVGKSLAYLVPETLFAKGNNLTVGVATKTNALSDQLVTHDLPLLNNVIPGGVTYYALKGYEHYPCLLRMEQSARADLGEWGAEQGKSLSPDAGGDILTALAVSFSFACQSIDGDLDSLGIRWRVVPRAMVAVGPGECTRNQCPFFPNECFVHGARRRAASADVLVTNHALLLRDIAMDNALLPQINHWVVDEAHGFEDEARRQWSKDISAASVRDAFMTLGDAKAGLLHELMIQAKTLGEPTLTLALLSKFSACAGRARESLEDFLLGLHGLAQLSRDHGDYGTMNLWIDDRVRNTDAWQELTKVSKTCIERLEATFAALKEAQDVLSESSSRLAAQIEGPLSRFVAMRDVLRLVFVDPDGSYVFSAEINRQKKHWDQDRLVAQKLDVGEDLKSWLEQTRSVIFTSATLAVGRSFEHFDHAVGLDRLPDPRHRDVALPSDYDFDDHMAIIVAEDMPLPTEKSYLSSLSDLLYDVHVNMGGSVLTLFTNRREMETVYREVSGRLSAKGLRLLLQDRGSSPRRLSQEFMSDATASLFALRSFWEGFDAAGDTLRCVVITKLPFANPNDPLVRERDLRDKRSWWKYSLPDAIISVKQAAGRLIRSSDDVGVLVLADARVAKKRYGRQVLDSMPSHNRIMLGRGNVGRFIELWRKTKGR